jgi:hypothetical protein
VSDDWKAPATCGCGEPATTGLRTCARCRVVRLGARLLPGEDFAALPQDVAPIVERSLLDAVAALERALAAKASSAGHPTVAWPARHGGIVRTFAASPAPDGALAGEAAVAIPTVEVRRG